MEKSSKIETRSGDLFAAQDLEAIVNPVNCVGAMGKGLALQFARRYPQILKPYRQACGDRSLTVQQPQVLEVQPEGSPRYVVNLATKIHWRNNSSIGWIEQGLASMYRQLTELGVSSVGIPALGAGLGGLPWPHVLAAIARHADQHPEIRTVVFAPKG